VVLALSVLGPFELRRDGELLRVPAGKSTELLIRLALDAGVPVRVDRLIEDLWGSDGVSTGRNTLQAKVSKLCRALGDAAVIMGSAAGLVRMTARASGLQSADPIERMLQKSTITDTKAPACGSRPGPAACQMRGRRP
jgi:DNA-binding SARP family transcriptional activator